MQFSCADDEDCKDPSDLFIKFGEEAKNRLKTLFDEAKPVDVGQIVDQAHMNLTDPPMVLKPPDGWDIADIGIFRLDPKSHEMVCVCWMPIFIARILPAEGGGNEKVELAFRRDERWYTVQRERTIIASSRNIVDGLADCGVNVTSENASTLVHYFSELEHANCRRFRKSHESHSLVGLMTRTLPQGWMMAFAWTWSISPVHGIMLVKLVAIMKNGKKQWARIGRG